MILQSPPHYEQVPPVLVGWLPWHHTAGGNNDFGLIIYNGGTLYIDEGRPQPDLIGPTVRNLRQIATTAYISVPRGYEALLLEQPPALDHGEVTDKGSINQRAVIEHRAALVEELYAAHPSPRVICTNFKEKTHE